jgi:tRNA dimethylallyltransferase
LSDLPSADPDLRARLEKECAADGLAALHARLAAVDPAAATRIHPHYPQRIQRALEVYELTGRPMTELYARRGNEAFPYRLLKLIIAPLDREGLHRRIEQRFQQMLEQGFIAEVERLRARGDLGLDRPSMRAVGYRQVWEYLDGLIDERAMVQRGVAATRQFAKRQLTWLRSEAHGVWLDSLTPRLPERVIEYLNGVSFFRD